MIIKPVGDRSHRCSFRVFFSKNSCKNIWICILQAVISSYPHLLLVFIIIYYLLMKHYPLPMVILHAIGIQLDWCWFTIRFYFRGYSDQHHQMSAFTAFPLQSLCIVSYSLMGICISLYSSSLVFFFKRHCNPCRLWPAQLSLSILSRKVFTECCCQRHVKPPTWRTSD